MDASNTPQLRRATVEDVTQLKVLWNSADLPVETLEKRFTEFQVLEEPGGRLLGALGLRLKGMHGLVHSEAVREGASTGPVRSQLWQRLLSVARNHGLARIWVRENAAFWREQGFENAAPDVLERLPQEFGPGDDAWLTLKLKEEVVPTVSLEHEFSLFKEAAKEQTEAAFRQARVLKILATIVSVLFFLLVIVGGFYFVKYLEENRRKGGGGLPMAPQQPPAK
ncbi:MAG: hypothetical protein AB1705_09180 [Verrucomicrobiota bacterium]